MSDTKTSEEMFNEVEQMPSGLQFFTYAEVAAILKVRRATVRSWVYRGFIRQTVKMGKKTLVPKSELQRFIVARTRVNDEKVFPLGNKKVVPAEEKPSDVSEAESVASEGGSPEQPQA